MNKYVTVYRQADGLICGVFSYEEGHPGNEDAAPRGCEYIVVDEKPSTLSSYIAGSPPAVTARPSPACPLDKSTITANGTDTATLSGIPAGSAVRVTDSNGTTDYTVNDGTLEITADEPGTITVTITPSFPYTPLTVTVTAT